MAEVPQWKIDQQKWVLANTRIPKGAIIANLAELTPNNSYDVKAFDVNEVYDCQHCGRRGVWTAERQQFTFVVKKGGFYAKATRCLDRRILEGKRIRDFRKQAGQD